MPHILHLKYEDIHSGIINVLGHVLKVGFLDHQQQHHLELVRNANPPSHPRSIESKTPQVGPSLLHFNKASM